MSDLYDSLEDESDEKGSSCESAEGRRGDAEGVSVGEGRKREGLGGFYLKGEMAEEESRGGLGKRNFLPKIEAPTRGKGLGGRRGEADGGCVVGWDGSPNIVMDCQILREQGLQINDDGSFTKSPRAVVEELPFITREYRNLQFQRKRTYKAGKKGRVKVCKKSGSGVGRSGGEGVVGGRREKGLSEETAGSVGSLSSRGQGGVVGSDNLTDAMKEKLLQSGGKGSCEALRVLGSLKKTERVMNLLEARKGAQQGRFSSPGVKSTVGEGKVSSVGVKPRTLESGKVRVEAGGWKAGLSYSERRQLESGFSPLHLRLGSKKVLSDTNRSNFGDSVAEGLSEISSRVLSCENIRDEEEEAFYRGLMEREKGQKTVQRSSRSEGPCEFPKLKGAVEGGGRKEKKEVRQNGLKFKPISKSMSIDLPSENESVGRNPKKNHYCSAGSSPTPSKYELAMKAKTYGYLANARNIFKMKAQSEGNLSPTEGERKNPKASEKLPSAQRTPGSRRSPKHPPKPALPEVPGRVLRAFDQACRAGKPPDDRLDLPRVPGAEGRDAKLQAEILHRMSSCLNPPNGRTEGVFVAYK